MAPDNRRVLRTFRVAPPRRFGEIRQLFTKEGAEQALEAAIDAFDKANPGHKYRLVALGRWRFKLVWDESEGDDDTGRDQILGTQTAG